MAPPGAAPLCGLTASLFPLLLLLFLPQFPEAVVNQFTRDYYDILSVEPTATERQIKKAYRSLALQFHPDRNQRDDAPQKFGEITEAYKVLSNLEQRRLYDAVVHEDFLEIQQFADFADETHAHFNVYDFSHEFGDGFFVEEPHPQWSSGFSVYSCDSEQSDEDCFFF